MLQTALHWFTWPYPAMLATWGVDKALQEIKTWAQTQLVAFSHFTCSVDLSWISGLNTQHISAHSESVDFWSNKISEKTIVSWQVAKLGVVALTYTNTKRVWERAIYEFDTENIFANSCGECQPHPVCAHALCSLKASGLSLPLSAQNVLNLRKP